MDARLLTPFVEAVLEILPQFGVQDIKKGGLRLKDCMASMQHVTALVGLSKQIRGNVAYSMSEDTAKKIVSAMMMGMPVAELDPMAQSALSELANMLAANAAIKFESLGLLTDISPPSVVIGDNVTVRMSAERTVVIDLITPIGAIEVNVGVETDPQ